MARDVKRLNRKARHLIRHLRRTRFASVQNHMLHELRHAISRRWGYRGPKKGPQPVGAGQYRPPTRKAKQLLTRLRKSKVWSVQKQLVNEIQRELERGRRLAERARQQAARARDRAKASAERMRRRAERARRAGKTFRETVNRGQERLLTRAERKQAQRGPRRPGRVRSRIDSWRRHRRPRAYQLKGSRWTWASRRASRPPQSLRPRPARNQAPRTRTPRPPRTRRAPRPARTR